MGTQAWLVFLFFLVTPLLGACGVGRSTFECTGPGLLCTPLAPVVTGMDPCPPEEGERRRAEIRVEQECYESWVGRDRIICVPRKQVNVRRECGR